MTNKEETLDYIPVVLAYPDLGYSPEELPEFIKAVKAFQQETAEQYKGKTIRYFFLPSEMVEMLSASEVK
jgi:hypothetical protein